LRLEGFLSYAQGMEKLKVSADELVAFARTIQRKTMKTMTDNKPFKVKVLEESGTQLLIFTPLSTKKPRKQQWKHIENVIEKFDAASEDVQWKTNIYGNNDVNASYQLALMAAYFKSLEPSTQD
jgi:hypothetical protein